MFFIIGQLKKIFEEVQVNKDFKRREFVVEVTNEHTGHVNTVKFELFQEHCALTNSFKEGDKVKVLYHIKGRKWEDKYFTTFKAFKISMDTKAETLPQIITGKVVGILDAIEVNQEFKKRDFVLQVTNEQTGRSEILKFELFQDHCELADAYKEGDRVKISFNIKGRKWEEKYFNTLQAWKIEIDN